MGLNSMQERVAILGGSFQVQSRPGAGTSITVEVPLPGEDPNDADGVSVSTADVGPPTAGRGERK